jgi:hypothetical protein
VEHKLFQFFVVLFCGSCKKLATENCNFFALNVGNLCFTCQVQLKVGTFLSQISIYKQKLTQTFLTSMKYLILLVFHKPCSTIIKRMNDETTHIVIVFVKQNIFILQMEVKMDKIITFINYRVASPI